jgi:hypothetical protein
MIERISTILVFFFLITNSFFAQQNVNLNPDPNGDPWYVDNYKLPSDMELVPKEEIRKVLQWRREKNKTLPYRLSHMYSPYMRPVFVQSGGSCGAASQICYMFGYEINNHRGLEVDGTDLTRLYPSHFTFMTVDEHSTQPQMAWFNGIPNAFFYGGETYSTIYGREVMSADDDPEYGWMQGYGSWKNAMKNKLDYNRFIFIETPEDLEFLKGWLFDHNGDTLDFNEGGVAGTGLAISGADIVRIPQGMYAQNQYIMRDWGPNFDHAMTFVGWDDSVAYDFNDDGQITNDMDITGDGIVDMADWERGAMITLNSWGDGWGNNGMVYIPYRVLKIHRQSAEFYHIRKNYEPKLIFKIEMKFSKRNALKLVIGIARDTSALRPERIAYAHHFIKQGRGAVPMLGRWADGQMHDEPMKFELDLTDLTYGFDLSRPFKIFLQIITLRTGGEGEILHLGAVEYYTNPNGNEIQAEIPDSFLDDGKVYYFPVVMPAIPDFTSPENIFINQRKLSVYYVDSQETTRENGRATNVLDGYPNTIWHTKYEDPLPHEIQFKLDSSYVISGFEYLPREHGGKDSHGRVKDFEIYVSEDPNDWGTPIYTGAFCNTPRVRRIFFDTPKRGQYVRFVALSEVNGTNWTTMSEFNLFTPNTPNDVEDSNPTPDKFVLYQNYPNPFNPATTISYSVPKASVMTGKQSVVNVALMVYNALGQKVATLVNEAQTPGGYSVQFNAKGLPSGVYFYTLRTDNFIRTRKMILLK